MPCENRNLYSITSVFHIGTHQCLTFKWTMTWYFDIVANFLCVALKLMITYFSHVHRGRYPYQSKLINDKTQKKKIIITTITKSFPNFSVSYIKTFFIHSDLLRVMSMAKLITNISFSIVSIHVSLDLLVDLKVW